MNSIDVLFTFFVILNKLNENRIQNYIIDDDDDRRARNKLEIYLKRIQNALSTLFF